MQYSAQQCEKETNTMHSSAAATLHFSGDLHSQLKYGMQLPFGLVMKLNKHVFLYCISDIPWN